ncbi:hypothetical protein LSUB1_G007932 [Lachnellula subtilissima]|uniref:Fungal N-terminal domain-containing protein n=1 Tax=Lachnellula subtilissima TaxID=602034 RepID=A0A8H8RFS7_9HELO|nr:hypothetical protein LSUB1_G007932 [Lachnellula subtilissima]
MSFGYSVGDFMLLTQLAYGVVQNARKACGAHHELAREIGSLHIVLGRVEVEVSKPDSILNNNEDNRKRELEKLARHCEGVLRVLKQVLDKYNALSEERRSVTKLWQKVRFGNGEMLDLGKIRVELATHTQALNLFLNLLSIGSQGKVEKYMDSHGEELRDIKHSLNWVTSSMQAKSHEEKSILTTYGDDNKEIWKALRRELLEEGFSGRLLDRHKSTIKKYLMELGARGALDEPIQQTPEEDIEAQSMSPPERPSSPVFLDFSSDSGELTDTEAEDEQASQGVPAHLEELSSHTAGQQMEEGHSSSSSQNESDEDNDQGRFTPLKLRTNTFATTALPSKSTSPSDNNSDKDEIPFERMASQKIENHNASQQTGSLFYEAHGEVRACSSGQPQLSAGKSRFTLQTSIEDVEDADSRDGAHPNCESSDEETSTIELPNGGSKYTTKISQTHTLETLDLPAPGTSNEDSADAAEAKTVEISRSTAESDTEESENKVSSIRAKGPRESINGDNRGKQVPYIEPREDHLGDSDGTINYNNILVHRANATWGSALEEDGHDFRNPFRLIPPHDVSEIEQFWYELNQLQLNVSRLTNLLDDSDIPWYPPSISFFALVNELERRIGISVRTTRHWFDLGQHRVASTYIERVREMNRLFMKNHEYQIRGLYASKGKQEDSLSWRDESWWRKESDPILSHVGRFSQTQ